MNLIKNKEVTNVNERIITGSARGTRLTTLDSDATRPTAEKVKEAIFSMIQFDIEGRRVLDLFGGSGQPVDGSLLVIGSFLSGKVQLAQHVLSVGISSLRRPGEPLQRAGGILFDMLAFETPVCQAHDKKYILQKQKSQTTNFDLIVWGFCFCVALVPLFLLKMPVTVWHFHITNSHQGFLIITDSVY